MRKVQKFGNFQANLVEIRLQKGHFRSGSVQLCRLQLKFIKKIIEPGIYKFSVILSLSDRFPVTDK